MSTASKKLVAIKTAPGSDVQYLLPPLVRAEAADVIAAIEAYHAAEEAFSLEIEGPRHKQTWLRWNDAGLTLDKALCSFLDHRLGPRFVRCKGVLYTSPEAGGGGYSETHIVYFDPESMDRMTVDLDADPAGQAREEEGGA